MNIGIAGAGLIGRLMAWQLLRAGHQVSIFDRDTIDGAASAAHVAAAMLAPFSEAVSCEAEIFHWGRQGLELWPQLLQRLRADCGNETPFQHRGSVLVAHPQDQNNLLDFNFALRGKVGDDYQSSVEILNQQSLQKIEAELADTFKRGTFLRDEGCIDNWVLLENLAKAIAALGGRWQSEAQVEKMAAGEIYLANKKYVFDRVIDCRGFGAKKDLKNLRGVRGEVLWLSAPEVNISRPVRLMHPRYQLYIVPKSDNVYVIGATEIESESMRKITVRSSLELQSALYSVHKGFAEANIIQAYANCRPAFMDNMPKIEIEPRLMSINGLYRHGYLLAPIVIQTALQALQGDDTPNLLVQNKNFTC